MTKDAINLEGWLPEDEPSFDWDADSSIEMTAEDIAYDAYHDF